MSPKSFKSDVEQIVGILEEFRRDDVVAAVDSLGITLPARLPLPLVTVALDADSIRALLPLVAPNGDDEIPEEGEDYSESEEIGSFTAESVTWTLGSAAGGLFTGSKVETMDVTRCSGGGTVDGTSSGPLALQGGDRTFDLGMTRRVNLRCPSSSVVSSYFAPPAGNGGGEIIKWSARLYDDVEKKYTCSLKVTDPRVGPDQLRVDTDAAGASVQPSDFTGEFGGEDGRTFKVMVAAGANFRARTLRLLDVSGTRPKVISMYTLPDPATF